MSEEQPTPQHFTMYTQGHKAIVELNATMLYELETPRMTGIRFAVYRQTADPDFFEMLEDNFFPNATLADIIPRWEKYVGVGLDIESTNKQTEKRNK